MKFILRWLNAAGLVLVLIMNYLAETIPIGGETTGEIAARYPDTLFRGRRKRL